MKHADAAPDALFPLHDGWSLAPEGAAVHREERVAVIADVHLGYEWARGHGGDCVPAHSLAETLARLDRLLGRVKITRLVVAGDLVESPRPCLCTEADVRRLTEWLTERGVELVALAGNHDPVDPGPTWSTARAQAFEHLAPRGRSATEGPREGRTGAADGTDPHPAATRPPSPGGRGSQCVPIRREKADTRSEPHASTPQVESPSYLDAIEIRGWTIAHGHRPLEATRTITGHHHPALRAPGVTMPCFVVGPTTIVLPAFSLNAAGWNVATGRCPRDWSPSTLRCVASAGEEWLDFGTLDTLARRMTQSQTSGSRRSG